MFKAFLIGLRDGFNSPTCLSSGVTWGDSRDVAYDRGVNIGQLIRSPRHAEWRHH